MSAGREVLEVFQDAGVCPKAADEACIDWTTDRLPALEERINSWLELNVLSRWRMLGRAMSSSRPSETNSLDL
jgi:hypothetical protein